MAGNMEKSYDPKKVEGKLYKHWDEKGYFGVSPEDGSEPYTIVMPPPNITGQLHMGHALDNTIQDVLIRLKRMQGFKALWIPGTDHAAIATEVKIVESMAKEGLTKDMLGRESFLKRAWDWKKHYGGRINEQLKTLGCSCDWSRERFTMDEGLSEAVEEFFIKLYNKGLIYRVERIINWCPKCNTSISDAEVDYEEKRGNLWHIKYPVKDSEEYIVVATTRPETMLGDTAVAVNPEDERYIHLIGKMVVLPLVGREIPIIADSYVEKDFGTGAVKITPAHDPNDFEVGIRHNLPMIRVMNDDGTINHNAKQYQGLDRYHARVQILKDLQGMGLLLKTEEYTHNVGACYRCNTVIEPLISKQWFVHMKPLAEPALQAVREGVIKFVPERFVKIYYNWLENIQDWCISRQLWWGHRIPAYYCTECEHIIVSRSKPDVCPKCGSTRIKQDNDTLDTWFSSALWPFSTLGWPHKTKDLGFFFPTSVLVTGYDIIFFWVARMIFSSLELTGKEPFKHVFIHGIVRDAEGKKMSKSLGNGIDPLEVIEKYGTDALRFALCIGNSPGNDLRFSHEKIDAGRNFSNKIWNASRFVLMNFSEDLDFLKVDHEKFTTADKWILSRVNTLSKEITENLERFELGIALQRIYEFIWDEFCDWYIEIVKPRLYDPQDNTKLEAQFVLNHVLMVALKLLHPFMPFITEEIYMQLIHNDESIMISEWPEYEETYDYESDEKKMDFIMQAIKGIRNVRAEMNVSPAKRLNAIAVVDKNDSVSMLEEAKGIFARLAGISSLEATENKENVPEGAVSSITPGVEIYIALEELVDVEEEIARLKGEKDKYEKELLRVDGKLGNEGFISKAPAEVVEEERQKRVKYQDMYDKVIERLKYYEEKK